MTTRDLLSLAATKVTLYSHGRTCEVLFRIVDVSLPLYADWFNATNDLFFFLPENCRPDNIGTIERKRIPGSLRIGVQAIRKFPKQTMQSRTPSHAPATIFPIQTFPLDFPLRPTSSQRPPLVYDLRIILKEVVFNSSNFYTTFHFIMSRK